MLDDIGQGLLDDAEGGQVRRGGQRPAPSALDDLHRGAGPADGVDDTVELVEARWRARARRFVVTKDPEERPHLRQRPPPLLRDGGQDVRGPVGLRANQHAAPFGLAHDDRERVGHDVVHLSRDPPPLGCRRPVSLPFEVGSSLLHGSQPVPLGPLGAFLQRSHPRQAGGAVAPQRPRRGHTRHHRRSDERAPGQSPRHRRGRVLGRIPEPGDGDRCADQADRERDLVHGDRRARADRVERDEEDEAGGKEEGGIGSAGLGCSGTPEIRCQSQPEHRRRRDREARHGPARAPEKRSVQGHEQDSHALPPPAAQVRLEQGRQARREQDSRQDGREREVAQGDDHPRRARVPSAGLRHGLDRRRKQPSSPLGA